MRDRVGGHAAGRLRAKVRGGWLGMQAAEGGCGCGCRNGLSGLLLVLLVLLVLLLSCWHAWFLK